MGGGECCVGGENCVVGEFGGTGGVGGGVSDKEVVKNSEKYSQYELHDIIRWKVDIFYLVE